MCNGCDVIESSFKLYNIYITKKHNPNTPPEEIEKRKIFKEFVLILANSGVRPKELLGVKVKEINELPYMTDDDKKKGNMVINIRKDNAKTGRSRSVVAPIRERLQRIPLGRRDLIVDMKGVGRYGLNRS